jgi:hypothetical protein
MLASVWKVMSVPRSDELAAAPLFEPLRNASLISKAPPEAG